NRALEGLRLQTIRQTESFREIEDVRRAAGAEADDRAELELERQADDAGGHNTIALAARYFVLRILRRARIIETEQIVAVLLRFRVRPDDVRAPIALCREWPVECGEETVVPILLAGPVGDDHVA